MTLNSGELVDASRGNFKFKLVNSHERTVTQSLSVLLGIAFWSFVSPGKVVQCVRYTDSPKVLRSFEFALIEAQSRP